MSRRKKDVPLNVLKGIEPYLYPTSDLYTIIDPGSSLLKYVDSDNDSDFFFEVTGYVIEKSNVNLYLEYKPSNGNDNGLYKARISLKDLDSFLNNWAIRLAEYQTVTTYEDRFLKQYEDEFNDEFELLADDDANTKSFNLDQQLWIDSYLTEIKLKLLDFKNESNQATVQIIENEITYLQQNQSSLTKQKVVKSLTKIWAKMRKEGINILKALYQEGKSELIKQLVSGGIENLHHLIK